MGVFLGVAIIQIFLGVLEIPFFCLFCFSWGGGGGGGG